MTTEQKTSVSAEEICCGWCGNGLTLEEFKYPNTHPDIDDHICDECYQRNFMDDCPCCDNLVVKEELSAEPGHIIGVWKECDANPENLQPGYYRVKEWPFYANYMFSGHFYASKLEKVAELDERGKYMTENASYPSGSLCEECRKEIEAKIAQQDAVTAE